MQESVWEFYCWSVCLNLFWFRFNACFTYEKTVINRRRVEKSAFGDQSEENSVWIIKWTTLSGIFCEKSFAPAVTSCYQVHADPHLSVALLHYLGATGAETSLLLTAYCIEVLTLSTLHARNSSYMHGRNLVGDTGDVSPHFFRWGGHSMRCSPHFFSSGFVFGEVPKTKVTFATFCVKCLSC